MNNKLRNQTILDFQRGDEKAFELVFKGFYPSLIVFTQKITGSQGEAEDITMEVFLSLFKRHNLFNSEPNIKAFLYVSARNRCFNYLKSKKRHNEKHVGLAERMQDNTLFEYEYTIKSEVVEAIYKEIENLPEKCRQIFKLIYLDGLKPAEVAAMLQISVNTVYVQKSRALNALRIMLSDNSLAVFWLIYAVAFLQSEKPLSIALNSLVILLLELFPHL